MKRLFAILLALTLLLCGCAAETSDVADTSIQTEPSSTASTAAQTDSRETPAVGVCLPEETDRWVADGNVMKAALEARGCTVELLYADASAKTQTEDMQKLITQGIDCLVVAAVDSALLTDVEQQALVSDIDLIAYDRMLMDTDAVSHYVAFDYKAIGTAIGQRIVAEKQLDDAERSYTVEFFMGSPEDNNAYLLYTGVMEVLQPYFTAGTLVCPTGRTAFEDTCMVDWSADLAADACGRYLAQVYTEQQPDILCAASDTLAQGCRDALTAAGYTAENFPMLTGCNAEADAVNAVAQGQQSFTVYLDTAVLAQKCADAAYALLSGTAPEVNDTESCHNNVKTVPAYLCDFTVVDKENCADFGAVPEPTVPNPTEETK